MPAKNRYQTVKNMSSYSLTRFSVIDTEGTTLGERHVCTTDTEQKANQVSSALNFNNRPSEYGYKLVRE